jgi:hypothetical protein
MLPPVLGYSIKKERANENMEVHSTKKTAHNTAYQARLRLDPNCFATSGKPSTLSEILILLFNF